MRDAAGQPHILHVNATGFMAAVEIQRHPELRERPFVVADAGLARGLVLAVSAAAWRLGLRCGLPLARIRSRPDIGIVASSPEAYADMQARLYAIACRYTPRVENALGGHLYLNLAGSTRLFGPPEDCAVNIRESIWQETGLIVAIALAGNKLLAKIGTRVVGPGGFIAVPLGSEADFLAHQDIALLRSPDQRLNRQLASLDFRDIGELARLDEAEVRALFGPAGALLREMARGIDHSELLDDPASQRRIEGCHVFASDTNDPEQITGALLRLSAETGTRMRGQGWSTRRIRLQIDYCDGFQAEGQECPPRALRFDGELAASTCRIFERSQTRRVRIRRITQSLELLGHEGSQSELFPPPGQWQHERLQHTLDRNRSRFGQEAILPLSAFAAKAKAER